MIRPHFKRYFIVVLLSLLTVGSVRAQGPINDSLNISRPSFTNDEPATTTPAVKRSTTKDTSFTKHSPARATLLSAVLPGAGQLYNRKYWKIPLIYAAGGAAVYGIVFYTREYNNFRNAYKERLANGFNVDPYYNQFQEPTLQSNRDYYRYYRDLSYIALGAVYILQVVDATVDAHFFDFQITEDLSLHVQPVIPITAPTSGSQVLFTLKF